MAKPQPAPVRPGPYDALVKALRAEPDVSSVSLASGGGMLNVRFANGASFDVSPRGDDRAVVSLTSLHSSERGRGHASSAMRTALDLARACEADVEIEVRPYGNVGLNAKALKSFYSRLGFIALDSYRMAYRH